MKLFYKDKLRYVGLISMLMCCVFPSFAQKVKDLKKLSLEELLEVEVTLVSRQPQKLTEVASAIQVLSNEDIRRSTATRIPEALKLLSNLQVSQVTSYATVVSARGFNYIFSNKLLVMIDGRTVYSPIFAGVYWDVQNVLLEDIEHIEAVSGPGGTLWGMNAVNGVINIETKSAKETQGLFVKGLYGSHLKKHGAIRYGGKLSDKFSYRVFAQGYDYNSLFLDDGSRNTDNWNILQGGFRIDGDPTKKDAVTILGNAYDGQQFTSPANSSMDGQNILGRWNHTISNKSDYSLQVYYDRTWRRDAPSTISAQVNTFDFEFHNSFMIGDKNTLLWGVGFRYIKDNILNGSDFVAFLPKEREMLLYSGFIQDQISLFKDKLKFTVGTKLQHNIYTGFELQPSGRVAYTPNKISTIWGAVSRAVRAPSRIDVDYHIPGYEVPVGTPAVDGGPDFESEKLLAYELGYRVQPMDNLSLSLSTFYNEYDDLYSVDPLENDPVRYRIQNNSDGTSMGTELYLIYQHSKTWRLRFGYNYFTKDLWKTNGSIFDYSRLANDPTHQLIIHSMVELPGNFQFDIFSRYVDDLSEGDISSYIILNARIAWLYRGFEVEIAGRNLIKERHQEFGSTEVPRNIYGGIAWRL